MTGGCIGDGGHRQRWDTEQPDADLIVIRRHDPLFMPPKWSQRESIIDALKGIGYSVQVVIINRDWHSTIRSQLKAPHAKNEVEAESWLHDTWHTIFTHMDICTPFLIVSYENLVKRPQQTIDKMFHRLGLERITAVEHIQDGNDKYYQYQ
jgi:hypothetical protein